MIEEYRLQEFISLAAEREIDFAEYTHKCGATDFVDSSYGYDSSIGKSVFSYQFKDFYTNPRFSSVSPYFVLALMGISYLLYEVSDEIMIWVCYTEKDCRGQGNITTLLKHLKGSFPESDIVIDTYNESLRGICNQLSFRTFRES